METAKVDIRKLQLLNDRINQLIDALNQVRLSVHGLAHTAPMVAGPTLPGYPAVQVPFPQGYFPGLAHTAGIAPQAPAPFPWLTPYVGLSHTTPEEAYTRTWMADPFLATRIGQTFPYAQLVFPPAVSIY